MGPLNSLVEIFILKKFKYESVWEASAAAYLANRFIKLIGKPKLFKVYLKNLEVSAISFSFSYSDIEDLRH